MKKHITLTLEGTMPLLDKTLSNWKALSRSYKTRSFAMYTSDGRTLTLSSPSDDGSAVVSAKIALLPDLLQKVCSWSSEVPFTSKKELMKALVALDAPKDIRTGLDKAKVSTMSVFVDSSIDDVFKIEVSKTRECSAEATWVIDWYGVEIDTAIMVSGQSDFRPSYKISFAADTSAVASRVITFLQDNELTPMLGKVEVSS
jgi:hypothetical protein